MFYGDQVKRRREHTQRRFDVSRCLRNVYGKYRLPTIPHSLIQSRQHAGLLTPHVRFQGQRGMRLK